MNHYNTYAVNNYCLLIHFIGYGKFHYEAIAVCATCIVTVGFQNGISSYVFPAAQCELNLTSFELGLLNIMFLSGGIISCLLWGILADINGRRKVLATTHLLNTLVTLTCAFISCKGSIVVCRFLNGFLIGAPGAIVFSYLAEFQPPKFRSASVCYCGLFFTSSWFLLPVLAHLVLSWDVNYQMGSFLTVSPWRLYLVLMVIPEAVVGVWFLRMPESPKFYMAKGDLKKALEVLGRMYSANTGQSGDMFPVKYLIVESRGGSNKFSDSDILKKKSLRILLVMLKQSRMLFQSPLVAATALTCTVMFSNMFG